MSLRTYRSKRDFRVTSEPDAPHDVDDEKSTRSNRTAVGGRFVVHRHRARRLHYDLRLEMDGVLVSWAVPRGPTLDPTARRLAVQVEDHPLGYFAFEGVIPAGEYGGGDVIVWDWGRWAPEPGQPDPPAALDGGELKFRLDGEKLQGRFVLIRTERSARERRTRPTWLLIHRRDGKAMTGWDPEAFPDSVKTGRTNDEVSAGAKARRRGRFPNARRA